MLCVAIMNLTKIVQAIFTLHSNFFKIDQLKLWNYTSQFNLSEFKRRSKWQRFSNIASCCVRPFSIDQTILNSILSIIIAAVKYALKLINSCIRTWFQLSPQFIPIKLGFYCYLLTCFIACYCAFLNESEHLSVSRSGYEKSH